jgi:hypothetical protein
MSFAMRESYLTRAAPYSGDVYRRATVCSYAELQSRPGSVAERLVAQLLRSFGTRQMFDTELGDDARA